MLVNSKTIYAHALKHHYGIGAFNFVNFETLHAIITSAEKEKSPVIVQTSTSAMKYMGKHTIVPLVKSLCDTLAIPVVLNLDHGKTVEDCIEAIDLGYTNVMFDGSSLPLEENIAKTKQVVEYAHMHNVTVEAELGVLAGIEDEVVVEENHSFYTDPKVAQEFVKQTQCDSLAIAIGTSHGAYKFKGNAQLRFDILQEVGKLLPDTPIVLHGASSVPQQYVKKAEQYGAQLHSANGVPENLLEKACKLNVCKVNVDTDLRICYTASIREYLYLYPSEIDIRKYNTYAMEELQLMIRNKIKNVFHSSQMGTSTK